MHFIKAKAMKTSGIYIKCFEKLRTKQKSISFLLQNKEKFMLRVTLRYHRIKIKNKNKADLKHQNKL